MALRFLLQPLAPILLPLVAYALAKSYAAWLRPLLNALALGLGKVWFVGNTLKASVLHIESEVSNALGNLVLAAEQPIVRWILALRTFILQQVYALTNGVIATSRAVETLADDVVAKLEVPVKVVLPGLRTKVRVLDRKSIAAIAAAVAAITALKHTATVTVPRGIEGEIGHLRDYLNRRADQLTKRIRTLEKPALAGLSVGLVYAALRRLGLGWVKCSNVNRTAKNVCGMNPALLESLLADTLLIAGTVSLVEFAEGMQAITAEVVGPIRTFWRAT